MRLPNPRTCVHPDLSLTHTNISPSSTPPPSFRSRLPGHEPAVGGAVGRVELGAGRRVPPVAAGGPGQRCREGREHVEEGPGQDDVVVSPDIQRQHEHRVTNPWR